MGVSTVPQFAAKCVAFSSVGLPAANTRALQQSALMLTQAARASIAAGSGGDSILSNVGRGARVGASFTIKGTGAAASAIVRGTGPLHLLDNPTSPHRIVARASKGRSQTSRAAFYNAIFGGGSGWGSATPLRTPYGPRMSVMHPGTKGKRTFWRAIEATAPMVPVRFQQVFRDEMRRYWG